MNTPLVTSAASFPGIPQRWGGGTLRWCWQYLDRHGVTALGVVARYNRPDGGKDVVPYFKPDGKGGWKHGGASTPRPLYGLHTLGRGGDVYVCEGERCAAALHGLGLPAVTSPGGSQAAHYADWTPLDGVERVIILPDNDAPGAKYADSVAGILAALPNPPEVVRVDLPGLPDKGDVVDWLEVLDWDGFEELPREMLDGLPCRFEKAVAEYSKPFTVPNAKPRKKKLADIETVCMADVEPEEIRWLWQGRLPAGKLVIVDGDPGVGKSTITIDLAARISTGAAMPSGCSDCREPAGVLILAPEDGLADTILPRLNAAGANLQRIHAPTPGEYLTLPDAIEWLQEFIVRESIGLVIIDPIMAFLGGADSYKDAEVRTVTTPLAGVADATGASILCVRHMTKGKGGPAIHKGGGSIAFTAAARVALTAAKAPDNSGRCVLAVSKGNLAAAPPALFYSVVGNDAGQPRIEWGGVAQFSADDLVADKRRGGSLAVEEAVAFLECELESGALPAVDLKTRAKEAGISEATLNRAKKKLGISPRRMAGQEGTPWAWELPPTCEDDQLTLEDDQVSLP
jgi:putative DNA primase/helicase